VFNVCAWVAVDLVPFEISSLGSPKVETPYHDNDLRLTPIISPQSGWQ
jgi:hypothetical protein